MTEQSRPHLCAEDLSGARWQRSSRSTGMNNCVETARLTGPGVLAVRDSKNPGGPALLFPPTAWTAFVEELRDGSLGGCRRS